MLGYTLHSALLLVFDSFRRDYKCSPSICIVWILCTFWRVWNFLSALLNASIIIVITVNFQNSIEALNYGFYLLVFGGLKTSQF